MKIVHVASEMFPYIKTGGLADAVGSLALTLADHGHEVAVFLPGHRAAVEHPLAAGAVHRLHLRIEMGDLFMSGDVRSFSPRPNLTVFFICREEFFDRRRPYGTPDLLIQVLGLLVLLVLLVLLRLQAPVLMPHLHPLLEVLPIL